MRRSRKASNRSHTTSISRLLNAARADAAAAECTGYFAADPRELPRLRNQTTKALRRTFSTCASEFRHDLLGDPVD